MSRPAAGTQIPVPVTQPHIDNGKAEDACDCAVALAVLDVAAELDLLPAADSVSVMYAHDRDGADARVWITPSSWLRLAFGPDCARFMRAVDAGQPVQPVTLMAEVA